MADAAAGVGSPNQNYDIMSDHFDNDTAWCELGSSCPLSAVHARLVDAHRLWHQALGNYENPDGFRTYLNACIQALRNVTFVLQKNKSRIPSFEEWYPEWQDRMRADETLGWIVNARNQIVKEGDLATTSIAKVAIQWSYLEPAFREFKVDPLKSTREIIEETPIILNVPQELYEDGVLVIERKWMVSELPEQELLDALAYAYGRLMTLTYDCHVQANLPLSKNGLSNDQHRLVLDREIEKVDARPTCMIASSEDRTFHLKLSAGEVMDVSPEEMETSPELQEIAKERYGEPTQSQRATGDTSELETTASFLFEQAKTVLKRDGHHAPMAFLVSKSKMQQYMIPVENKSEKFRIWNWLAVQVEKHRASRVMVIAESWMAPADDTKPYQTASDLPERREVISVVGADMSGDKVSIMCPFERVDGDIIFGETYSDYIEEINFLQPVYRVWNRLSDQ